MGIFLEMSIAGRKCMCVSRKVVLCSKHFDFRILVPMSYFKLWNYIYCLSRRQRKAIGAPLKQREATEARPEAAKWNIKNKVLSPSLYIYIYIYIYIYKIEDICKHIYICTLAYKYIIINSTNVDGTLCVNNKGHLMHNSNAIWILICVFDSPCLFYIGGKSYISWKSFPFSFCSRSWVASPSIIDVYVALFER